MKALKWNYDKCGCAEYELPEGSAIYTYDMDKNIACAQCGKEITFGDSYTSFEVHSQIGFGYAVCGDCYKEEWKRKIEAENRECDEWVE